MMSIPAEIRKWVMLGLFAVLMMVMMGVLTMCHQRDQARRLEAEKNLAQGRTLSASKAIEEIDKLSQRGEITDKEVQNAQDAIRQASPADRDVVARWQLCRLQHRTDCDRMQ